MKVLKRFAAWVISSLRRVIEPDFTATHAQSHHLSGTYQGAAQEDYLAGYPRHKDQNEPLAGFPRRAAMLTMHGWRMPTPPRLPVDD